MIEYGLNTIILLAAIILPGTVFLRFYYNGGFTGQFNAVSRTSLFFLSIIPGIAIQFLTFYLYCTIQKLLLHFGINDSIFFEEKHYNFFKGLFNPGFNGENILDSHSAACFLVYMAILLLIAATSAILYFNVVRYFRLDKRWSLFQFQNYWHYFFKGEFKQFSEFQEKKKEKGKPVSVYADVLVQETDSKSKLYSGELKDYRLSNTTKTLETIFLTNVLRWKKVKNENEDVTVEIKKVPTDVFIIPYSKILNINLRLAFAEPEAKSNTSSSPNISIWIVLAYILLLITFGSYCLIGFGILISLIIIGAVIANKGISFSFIMGAIIVLLIYYLFAFFVLWMIRFIPYCPFLG